MVYRCVVCDTPFEDAELEECHECGADPFTGAVFDDGFVPLSVLHRTSEAAEEQLLLLGIGEDGMDLVTDEERRIERLSVA